MVDCRNFGTRPEGELSCSYPRVKVLPGIDVEKAISNLIKLLNNKLNF